jgi:hypothetical protein
MPAPPTNDAVRTARTALAAADEAEAAQQELTEAQRALDQDLRPAVAARRADLQAALTAWFDGVTVDGDIARLPAFVPIIFFPVRVETRFDRTTPPGVMKVRIYPDEIFIDSHETRLTRDEVEDGKHYYQDAFAPNPTVDDPELEAWRAIVKKMSPERAAYVLRVMEPTTDEGGNVIFPTPPLKTDAWTRAGTAVLPDRWVVVVYRGNNVRRYQSNLVTEPLAVTVDPTHTEADQVQVPGSDGLLKIDQDIAWTLDYDRAVAAGMAVTVPLVSTAEAADLTGGFDKVIVFGVKTSMPPADTGAHLQGLFEAQHYTRGLGLVKQGSPTNNTEDAPTPLPRDPADRRTFLEERAGGLTQQGVLNPNTNRGGDVAVLAKFFGFLDAVFPNVLPPLLPGPDSVGFDLGGHEQARADAMNRALWPVLFGYYIQNFVNVTPTGQATTTKIDYDQARSYFKRNVRARGPAPAFRVGLVPYGLLPTVALSKWEANGAATDDQLEIRMIDVLRRLAEQWKRASANVARVKPGLAAALPDLLKALALAPSAREMRIREVLGSTLQFNLAQFTQIDYTTISNAISSAVSSVFRRAGVASWTGSALAGLLHNSLSKQTAIDFVVAPEQISEEQSLPSDNNYVDALRPGPTPPRTVVKVADIFDDKPTFGGLEKTMFYKLLRNAVLTEITRIAAALVGPTGFTRLPDQELVGVRGDLTVVATSNQLLKRTDFAVSGGAPLGDFARLRLVPNPPDGLPTFVEMNTALATLAFAPTAELDRLFAETVDLASHRLDPWITALAARRVLGFRDSQIAGEAVPPLGSHLGGYAFLENVRPGPTPTGPIETQPYGGGFVQAPSLPHAAAAAVLRSGYLAYRSEDPQKYAIDLSSERVRGAREVLETIRAGNTLGEVLGQMFERRLHDDAPDLDAVRYALRLRYPLVAGKAVPLGPGDSADRVAARNVVDGLQLWTASRQNQVPWGAPDLPTSARARVEAEIQVLAETIDRVADLAVSESVFQLVRGNVTSAVGQMDALSRGRAPSDPEVAENARGGPGLTHRAALVFPDNAPAEGAGWPAEATPRARVEPALDRWLTNVLGNPGDVACAVTLNGPGGATSTKTVTLAALAFDDGSGPKRLRPLDVIALAREVAVANQGSLLDRWIAAAALRGETDRTVAAIDYALQASAPRTFPEVMEVARAAAELLGGARALSPGDLSLPSETPDRRAEVEQQAKQAAQQLMTAADDANNILLAVRGQLQNAVGATTLRNTLQSAASYIPTLFPLPDADADALDAARTSALAELDRRETDFQAIEPIADTSTAIVDAATRKLRVLFGNDFLPLPSFPLPGPKEIGQSLDARDALLGSDGTAAISRFLQQASQVQEGLARWRTLSLYMGALGGWRPRLDVVQIPFKAGELWAALPLAGDDPPEGRVSLVLLSDGSAAPSSTVAWRGVVLDGWVERIPSASEETGVAFNFDNPVAEAGQAVLIAAPPGANGAWTYDNVLATLSETFDLAKIRTVDRELLDLGQLLPTSYLAQDHQNNTVSTRWSGAVRVPTTGS